MSVVRKEEPHLDSEGTSTPRTEKCVLDTSAGGESESEQLNHLFTLPIDLNEGQPAEGKLHEVTKLGVFDSGIGGMSFVKQLRCNGLGVEVMYVADTKYMPYGLRTKAELVDRVNLILDHLFSKGCEAVVIACNTASAALPESRYYNDRRVVGVIDPTVERLKALGARDIHIVATVATVDAGLHKAGLGDLAVSISKAPTLASIIEFGNGPNSPEAQQALENCLEEGIRAHAKQLLLACTHYEAIDENKIKTLMPKLEQIWLPCQSTLQQVRRTWNLKPNSSSPIQCFSTGGPADDDIDRAQIFGVNLKSGFSFVEIEHPKNLGQRSKN